MDISFASDIRLIGMVLLANAITVFAFWGMRRLHSAEKRTGDAKSAPMLAFVAVLVPCGLVAFSAYLDIIAR